MGNAAQLSYLCWEGIQLEAQIVQCEQVHKQKTLHMQGFLWEEEKKGGQF